MSSHKISWGKVIAGAAIAAGAIAVIAYNAEAIGDFLKSAWDALVGSADTASVKAAEAAAQNVDKIAGVQEGLTAATEVSKGLVESAASISDPQLAAEAIKSAETAASAFSAASTSLEPVMSAAQETAKEAVAVAAVNNSGLLGILQQYPRASIASAAGIGGLIAAYATHKDRHKEEQDLESQSFSAQEDMRRMQALMVARMQAQGYQPAMAMNNGMSR